MSQTSLDIDEPEFTREFPNTGESLSGWHAAFAWLHKNDYSCGSIDGNEPVGIRKGSAFIPQWRHIHDRGDLDGRVTWKGGFRRGAAVVTLKEAP